MKSEKGFTLMEMLIVVAIIAVLIAVGMPIYSDVSEKSREATDQANLRVAYAQILADGMFQTDVQPADSNLIKYDYSDKLYKAKVYAKQTDGSGWLNSGGSEKIAIGDVADVPAVAAPGSWTLENEYDSVRVRITPD